MFHSKACGCLLREDPASEVEVRVYLDPKVCRKKAFYACWGHQFTYFLGMRFRALGVGHNTKFGWAVGLISLGCRV